MHCRILSGLFHFIDSRNHALKFSTQCTMQTYHIFISTLISYKFNSRIILPKTTITLHKIAYIILSLYYFNFKEKQESIYACPLFPFLMIELSHNADYRPSNILSQRSQPFIVCTGIFCFMISNKNVDCSQLFNIVVHIYVEKILATTGWAPFIVVCTEIICILYPHEAITKSIEVITKCMFLNVRVYKLIGKHRPSIAGFDWSIPLGGSVYN